MQIITTKLELSNQMAACIRQGKSIGFVPTMGALHAGHASLVKQACAENAVCVVSVFVNPTQFNNKEDLLKYPRNIKKDAELLADLGVHFVFAPTPEEMYSQEEMEQEFAFDFAGLDQVMEGKMRPGHFNGVVQVVSRLFDLVQPTRAYFGEKDFQQLAIIREMVKSLEMPVQIVGCPIVREFDGLALSSRNARLSDMERKQALNISKTLFDSVKFAENHTVVETQQMVENAIRNADGLELEYFEIVDGNTLQKITAWEDTNYAVGCITVFCGDVRLIDNIKLKG